MHYRRRQRHIHANDEYENLVNATAKYLQTNHRTKSKVPWETLMVREKRPDVKTTSKSYRKNPTNTNAQKPKNHKMNKPTNTEKNKQNIYKIR